MGKYRSGYIKTKIFRDSDGDAYGIPAVKAEEKLEDFLNELGNWGREDYQKAEIMNISMSVDNGKTSILLVLKYL